MQGQRWSTGRVQEASGAWSRAFSRIRPGPQPDAQSPRWGQLHSATLALSLLCAHTRSGPGQGAACFTGARLMPVRRLSLQTTIKGLFFQTSSAYRRMISLVWLTVGRSLKPIYMQDGGGTPGLGGSLSWCNEESPHRFPVLRQDQLRDIR